MAADATVQRVCRLSERACVLRARHFRGARGEHRTRKARCDGPANGFKPSRSTCSLHSRKVLLVPWVRFELTSLAAPPPQDGAVAYFATRAFIGDTGRIRTDDTAALQAEPLNHSGTVSQMSSSLLCRLAPRRRHVEDEAPTIADGCDGGTRNHTSALMRGALLPLKLRRNQAGACTWNRTRDLSIIGRLLYRAELCKRVVAGARFEHATFGL